MDKKFDIMSHPNIKLTADGGNLPYTHNKQGKYFRKNLSVNLPVSDDTVIDMDLIKESSIEIIDFPDENIDGRS